MERKVKETLEAKSDFIKLADIINVVWPISISKRTEIRKEDKAGRQREDVALILDPKTKPDDKALEEVIRNLSELSILINEEIEEKVMQSDKRKLTRTQTKHLDTYIAVYEQQLKKEEKSSKKALRSKKKTALEKFM